VSADKPTNSLVIVASVGDFLSLREVIRKLDTPRPQVYIEATIVEVGVDNGRDLGVSFHGGADFGDGNLLLGGVQHTDLSSLNVATLATARGLVGGALGSLLPGSEQLLGQSIPSFGVLFQALATNSNVNVLSSPHILTTDNEEAEISVGENIPYQGALTGLGGGAGGAAGGFFPTQSIQRQDVALTLKITPQINASNMVRLAIDLEISDIASEDFQGLGPSWSKRTIKDTVVVQDQQAVIIGGLISDRVTNTESKVPLLGDIPILGYLFKYSQKRKVKRNLLVLLTPYIVKGQMDIEQIVERRVREQREFIRSFSNFRQIKYRPNTDYRRKRGVVEEINRSLIKVEKDAELLRELDRKRVEHPDGPIEYFEEEEGDGEDDGGSAGGSGDASSMKTEPAASDVPAEGESPPDSKGGKEAV
jgi:general secretion pathway protein D